MSQDDIGRIGDFLLEGLLGPGILAVKVADVAAANAALADLHQHQARLKLGIGTSMISSVSTVFSTRAFIYLMAPRSR